MYINEKSESTYIKIYNQQYKYRFKMFLAVYTLIVMYFLLRVFGRSMCFVRRRPAGGSREREIYSSDCLP